MGISTKFTRTKYFALSCPVPCTGRPAGQTGQGKKENFTLQGRTGQDRAPGQSDCPALMTISARFMMKNAKKAAREQECVHDARERNVGQYFSVLCDDDLLMIMQDKMQLHNLLLYFTKNNLVVLRHIFEIFYILQYLNCTCKVRLTSATVASKLTVT